MVTDHGKKLEEKHRKKGKRTMITQKVSAFFERIFNKKEKQKMLIEPKIQEGQKVDFINKLKVETIDRKTKVVETPICFGDGLGIQTKIRY